MKSAFTYNIIALRKNAKYTQKYVADKIGMTYGAYVYCERGNFPEKFEQFINLCKLYNVDANKLLGIEKNIIYPELNNNKENNV